MKKQNLQRHRIRAFHVTLGEIGARVENRIRFINDYAVVYKFPKRLTAQNLKKLRRWAKATQNLKDLEHSHL